MANSLFADLQTEVLPHLASDPSDPLTMSAIKRACIEFCRESWVWKYLCDPVDVTAGEACYYLEAPKGSDIVTVVSVIYAGTPLEQKSIDWLDANVANWRTQTGTPRYFTQVDTEQVILAHVPDSNSTNGLTITVALQPSQSAAALPKWIFSQFIYELANGAVAHLMLMPNKPWTDIAAGADRRNEFDKDKANARAAAVAALGRAVTRSTSQH